MAELRKSGMRYDRMVLKNCPSHVYLETSKALRKLLLNALLVSDV